MKKSLKIIGCLLALLVPAGCSAVKKNLFTALLSCCFGDSREDNVEEGTVYESRENTPESDIDPLEQKTEELLKGQEEVFVNIGEELYNQVKKSNDLVNEQLGNEKE